MGILGGGASASEARGCSFLVKFPAVMPYLSCVVIPKDDNVPTFWITGVFTGNVSDLELT